MLWKSSTSFSYQICFTHLKYQRSEYSTATVRLLINVENVFTRENSCNIWRCQGSWTSIHRGNTKSRRKGSDKIKSIYRDYSHSQIYIFHFHNTGSIYLNLIICAIYRFIYYCFTLVISTCTYCGYIYDKTQDYKRWVIIYIYIGGVYSR